MPVLVNSAEAESRTGSWGFLNRQAPSLFVSLQSRLLTSLSLFLLRLQRAETKKPHFREASCY